MKLRGARSLAIIVSGLIASTSANVLLGDGYFEQCVSLPPCPTGTSCPGGSPGQACYTCARAFPREECQSWNWGQCRSTGAGGTSSDCGLRQVGSCTGGPFGVCVNLITSGRCDRASCADGPII